MLAGRRGGGTGGAGTKKAIDQNQPASTTLPPSLPSSSVASSDVRTHLANPATRAAAAAVLASPYPAAALEAATARGGPLASLSDAVLDTVAPHEKA